MKKISNMIIEPGTKDLKIDKTRVTIRAIIPNEDHQLLMVYAPKLKDYTFPGVGMKKDEDHIDALKREMKEELGANTVINIKPYGYIEEKRFGLSKSPTVYLQTSYYYIASVADFGKQQLAEREIDHGVIPVWVDIDDALKVNRLAIKNGIKKRGMHTVLPRENAVLKDFKKHIQKRQTNEKI